MNSVDIQTMLQTAIDRLNESDRHLLQNDVSERCIASRLAMYLQPLCPGYFVDVEYNRAGDIPKRLNLPPDCANYQDPQKGALVVPDVIVHRRGPDGPNLLVVELKKTTNSTGPECDRQRVPAFVAQFGYQTGALIECETRPQFEPRASLTDWWVK